MFRRIGLQGVRNKSRFPLLFKADARRGGVNFENEKYCFIDIN